MQNRLIFLKQYALKCLGFNPGPLDGIDGPQTKDAYKKWKAVSKIKKGHAIYLQQHSLKSLGFSPGALDGVDGPLTKAAFNKWNESLVTIQPDEIEDAIESKNLDITAASVKIAAAEVGIRESSHNRGSGIEKYWDATTYKNGYQNREPYCAAFLCWVIREACRGKKHKFALPKSALAYGFETWGKANTKNGVEVFTNSAKRPRVGDIFTLTHASHVGIVKHVNGSKFTTVEANTNDAGSREGDGVYSRTRSISGVRRFIRMNA